MNQAETNSKLTMEIIGAVTKYVAELQIEIQTQLKIQRAVEEILQGYTIEPCKKQKYNSDIPNKVQSFLNSKSVEDGLADNSLYGYDLILTKLSDYLSKPVSLITTNDLRDFIADTYEDNAQISKNNKITCIKSFFTWLQNEGHIIQNPAIKLKSIKVPYKERRSLTPQEIIQMRKACNTLREHTIFELLLSSGICVSELCDIQINDIDFNENTILIHGKGNKERTVFFDTKTKRWLLKYLNNRPKTVRHSYLFVALKYPFNKLSKETVEDEIKRILSRTDIEKNCTPHVLRHTFATIAVNNDMPLPVLQKLLGHSSPETTQIYYDINTKKLKKEYQKLAM